VIFGAVGDDTRLEYTVIGEPVNLAAKLDKHNKKSGTRAMATQDAFAMALAQGYHPKAPRQTRRACWVDGTDAPVDLVGASSRAPASEPPSGRAEGHRSIAARCRQRYQSGRCDRLSF
jgi:class 3 adenylate cyclase